MTGQVAAGAILVDGLGIGDVGNVVLRDRQHLAEDGIMIVVVALDSISGQIASGPDLVSRGFVYVKESDALMDEARDLMENVMEGCVSRGCTDWGRIKTAIKDNLGDFIWKKTKRRPMIYRSLWKCKVRGNMSRVETALEELIAAVIASEEYREYDRQKQIMKEQPELKAQIDRFRQENFELQNSVQADELFDRTDEFSRRLEEFRKNPLVDAFLNAELDFCRMIQEINGKSWRQ